MNKFLAWIVTAFLTFAIVLSLLATASAFAGEPQVDEPSADLQSQSRPATAEAGNPPKVVSRPAAMSASEKQAASKRVYLEDFQLIHKPVTKKRSTEMVWLGKSKRPN